MRNDLIIQTLGDRSGCDCRRCRQLRLLDELLRYLPADDGLKLSNLMYELWDEVLLLELKLSTVSGEHYFTGAAQKKCH